MKDEDISRLSDEEFDARFKPSRQTDYVRVKKGTYIPRPYINDNDGIRYMTDKECQEMIDSWLCGVRPPTPEKMKAMGEIRKYAVQIEVTDPHDREYQSQPVHIIHAFSAEDALVHAEINVIRGRYYGEAYVIAIEPRED